MYKKNESHVKTRQVKWLEVSFSSKYSKKVFSTWFRKRLFWWGGNSRSLCSNTLEWAAITSSSPLGANCASLIFISSSNVFGASTADSSCESFTILRFAGGLRVLSVLGLSLSGAGVVQMVDSARGVQGSGSRDGKSGSFYGLRVFWVSHWRDPVHTSHLSHMSQHH